MSKQAQGEGKGKGKAKGNGNVKGKAQEKKTPDAKEENAIHFVVLFLLRSILSGCHCLSLFLVDYCI